MNTLRHHTHPKWGQIRRARWGQIKLSFPTSMATPRTHEATRPAQPLQIVQTVRIGAEPGLELADRPRIVHASTRAIHKSHPRPVKWIPLSA